MEWTGRDWTVPFRIKLNMDHDDDHHLHFHYIHFSLPNPNVHIIYHSHSHSHNSIISSASKDGFLIGIVETTTSSKRKSSNIKFGFIKMSENEY